MKWMEIIPFSGFLVLVFLIAGRIIFLKRKGVAVSASSEKTNWKTVLLYLLFLLILSIWTIELARPVFPFKSAILPGLFIKSLSESLFLDFIGSAAVFAGLILMTASLLHFKKSLRFGFNIKNQGQLITSGAFSFSRNPFFLSLDFYFLGVALIFSNLFFIGFAVLAIISIHFFILKEEKFMLNVYGENYREYRKKVRRYF